MSVNDYLPMGVTEGVTDADIESAMTEAEYRETVELNRFLARNGWTLEEYLDGEDLAEREIEGAFITQAQAELDHLQAA